jgi:ParB family chromosome partitioning protein
LSAAKSKFGLGKGLDALLPSYKEEGGNEQKTVQDGVFSLPLEKIRANPNQPRKSFDADALREMADSIREHGVIQPIIVEADGENYAIIAGERRYRASILAGLVEIPAIVRDFSAEERLAVALIENVQRADLNPIEEAAAYKSLIELTGKNQDEIAAKVGKSRSAVTNALRLLKLPSPMRKSLETGEISSGHARALLAITDDSERERVFNEIISDDISVREAEKRAFPGEKREKNRKNGNIENEKSPQKRDPHLISMEEKFIETLGTKVHIDGDFNKGVIRIEYFSMQDLDRLYELIASR